MGYTNIQDDLLKVGQRSGIHALVAKIILSALDRAVRLDDEKVTISRLAKRYRLNRRTVRRVIRELDSLSKGMGLSVRDRCGQIFPNSWTEITVLLDSLSQQESKVKTLKREKTGRFAPSARTEHPSLLVTTNSKAGPDMKPAGATDRPAKVEHFEEEPKKADPGRYRQMHKAGYLKTFKDGNSQFVFFDQVGGQAELDDWARFGIKFEKTERLTWVDRSGRPVTDEAVKAWQDGLALAEAHERAKKERAK